MAKKAILELKRGDGATRQFKLPISLYHVGAILGFAAKPIPDNDVTDAAAVISREFTDADVDIVTDPNYAIYTMVFDPADTASITFDTSQNETRKIYVGEFQYKTLTGNPVSFPGNDDYIEVIVYADVRMEVP